MIAVDDAGENLIIVAPGANHQVGPPEVAAASPARARHPGHQRRDPRPRDQPRPSPGGPAIFNLAPAPENARALVERRPALDWLVVNESEAAAVLGRPVSGLADAAMAAADLIARGPRHAVVTAGAHGAALASARTAPPPSKASASRPVDTVGAGDTFVGALAVALAAGVPAPEAVTAAAAAGAAAVTRHGAQTAMPRPADVLAVTGVTWPLA